MAMNVNKLNQNNGYGTGNPKVDKVYSSIAMGNTIESTGDMGLLIPAHVHELLPSQRMNLSQSIGIQFNPFVSNLFHEINGEILRYFVPFRILWDKWEEFAIGGVDGQDNTAHPTMSLKELWEATEADPAKRTLLGTLADYFGMPINWDFTQEEADADKPTAFLWWAYNTIYNEHIRLIDIEPTPVDKDNNKLLRGNYDWDYFTRSRVYQQRGVSPTIPVSDEMLQLAHEETSAVPDDYVQTALFNMQGNSSGQVAYDPNTQAVLGANTVNVAPHSLEGLGMNMNNFLLGLGIMRLQINNAKIQPKYCDQLEMRFDIYPEDVRLQRPEYLGSEYFNVSVDTVTQTSGETTSGGTRQGNITGQAWGSGNNMNVSYQAKEHGFLFTMFIIRPKSVYEGGLSKRWIKKTRFDYATPELANTPDVEVKRGELMYTGVKSSDDTLFGWQGIYEEYRTLQNMVTGRLRPSQDDNLVSYTLARHWKVGSEPALNKEFIQCNPDQERILQYVDEPAFMYFVRNDIKTTIPLPIQSEPGDLSFL